MNTHFDVIIVGAGLSGIGAAYHIQSKCPSKNYKVLEARENLGGTWDLFKYPGIRSDSDMYTLGFPFNPWQNTKSISSGADILNYIKDTATKFGIDKHIQFSSKVHEASWQDETNSWTLSINKKDGTQETITTNYLFMCSGYYNYDKGYTPIFKDIDKFKGKIIHPQKWKKDFNYEHKKIVIIGSGATAVTMVPEMAKKASKVTMLQRSPSYIVSQPSEDKLALVINKLLPSSIARHIIRWKNIFLGIFIYSISKKFPKLVKKMIAAPSKKVFGEAYVKEHLSPNYNPWDQRLCVVPDGDFFKSIQKGKSEIVTDHIDSFTETGVLLQSGKTLAADIIVTATGLEVQLLGGMKVKVNGVALDSSNLHSYRGVLFSKVPNFAIAVGYTNATWTLKCDLNCQYVCKVLNYMDENGFKKCTPIFDENRFASSPLLDFDAGYIKRAHNILPKQGSASPWKVNQNYIKDTFLLKYGSVNDEFLSYE